MLAQEFVGVAQQAAMRAQSLQTNAVVGDLKRKGENAVAQLDQKLMLTNELLNSTLRPAVTAASVAVREQYDVLKAKLDAATEQIKEDQEKLKDLRRQRALLSFLDILGDLLNFMGEEVLGGATKAVAGWATGEIDKQIESLKAEIMENLEVLKTFEPLVPLLVSIQVQQHSGYYSSYRFHLGSILNTRPKVMRGCAGTDPIIRTVAQRQYGRN